MPGHEYRVRVPEWARPAFQGKSRLRQRFSEPAAGLAWVRRIESQIASLRARVELTRALPETQLEPQAITLRSASDGWLQSRPIRPKTRRCYEELLRHLLPRLGNLPLDLIGPPTWDDYCSLRRRDGASDDALARERGALLSIVRWAQTRGLKVSPELLSIPKPRVVPQVTRRYDPESLRRAIDQLDGRDRAIVEVASLTGMRAGELRAFDCSWIRWDEGRIEVPHDQTYSPKGRRSRSIGIPQLLRAVLASWLGDRREGRVFPPLTPGRRRAKPGAGWAQGFDTGRLISRVRAATGLELHGLHDLRHHYLSMLAASGAELPDLMSNGGHRTAAMAQRYIHTARGAHLRVGALLDRHLGAEVGAGSEKKAFRILRRASL